MQSTLNTLNASPIAPAYTLYDPQAITLATFLGSPAAGALLLGLNFRRMGRSGAAVVSIILGILVTLILIGLGFALPKGTPSFIFWIPQIIGMSWLAKLLQGNAVAAHRSAGGKLASRWKAAGIGLVSLVIIFAVIFAIVMTGSGSRPPRTRIAVGNNDEIYYSGAATHEEAMALANALKADGFLTDRGVSVLLSKTGNGTVVSFVVQEGIWDDAHAVHNFEIIGRNIAPGVGGLPLTVRLVNSQIETKKEISISAE